MSKYSRRDSLKLLGALSAVPAAAEVLPAESPQNVVESNTTTDTWDQTHDCIWLGSKFWANPMEDWSVVDGAAECLTGSGDRNVHLITHLLTNPDGELKMSVRVTQVAAGKSDDGVGFKIGVKSDLNETKSNCFAKSGLRVGLREGKLQVGSKRKPLAEQLSLEDATLEVHGRPDGNEYALTLVAKSADGSVVGTLTHNVSKDLIAGNVAIVNNFDTKTKKGQGARYRFHDWQVSGDAFTFNPDAEFGPILWTMYSLSDSRSDEGFVLKLSALTPPLGKDDNDEVELQVRRGEKWEPIGKATLDHDAWTATFRIPNWDATGDVPFQVVYRQSHRSVDETFHDWTGTIKANPVGRELKFAPLTCQKDYAFPYAPVAENLLRLDPDLIYFSGDQLYEGHGGYGLIRDPAEAAIVNYLRKFYMFGWAFREPMRHSPTLCIPDDHDVFQGNIWGEGGAAMQTGKNNGASSKGGYREPVRMVNAVHRTCAGHHPDPYDPTPAKRGMSVYYGDMVYGGVSFAILGDRQFKSGPDRVETGSGRADHVRDRDFDTSKLDVPGLELLGQRQEDFLKAWSKDWRNASIKVLLSQTVFSGVATHHGSYDGFLVADLDSGGWPQTARNRTIDILRESKALHVNGDQHLTSLTQYGVNRQRDANWSFCVPAIAAGYPRWWRPDEENLPHANRPEHGLANTGEYLDGFGNKVYVYAVGNPVVGKAANRYDLAHEKASGFGWILIDPKAKTCEIHSFRFLVDATDGNPENEFPGWPVTVHMDENAGLNRLS